MSSIKENFLKYRRTYLSLEEALYTLQGKSKHSNDDLFRLAFSFFFLLGEPYFDHKAHLPNSIQTFYANHYLRETLKLEVMIKPKEIYEYSLSEKFKNTILLILKDINLEENIDFGTPESPTVSKNDINHIIPSKFIIQFISFASKLASKQNKASYINTSSEPSESIFEQIKENGYTVKEKFVTPSTLKSLQYITNEIANHEKKSGSAYFYGENGQNQRIYNLISKHPIFQDLISCPYLVNVCDRVFERQTFHEKFGLNSMTGHIVAPGSPAIPWHLDSVTPEPLPKWMVRFICILALDDFTLDNGATAFIPGSHKLMRRPTPNDLEFFKDSETIVAPAGSLILFDGAVWHHSTANTSKKHRPGLMLSYAASYFMELCGEEEHLTVIPKNRIESFSPKVKQMIGFRRAIKKGATDISNEIYKYKLPQK